MNIRALPPLQFPAGLSPDDDSHAPSGATWTPIATTLGAAAGGAAVGFWMFAGEPSAAATPEADLSALGIGVALAGLALIALLALAAHEAGHLVGGWASGFRFHLFVVGPLMLTRTGDGIKAQLHTNWSLYGGLAASLPTDLHDLRRREAYMVAGGPAMSVLLGAGAMGAYIAGNLHSVLPSGPVPLGWMAAEGLFFFGTISLGIGLITLIPTTTSGFYTDGARLLRMARNHPAAERDAAVFALTALQFVDRPREWAPAVVAQAHTTDDDTLFDVEGRRLAYLHALDTGDMTQARCLLQEALDRHTRYPDTLIDYLTAEAAFFEGAVRNDGAAAAQWVSLLEGGSLLDEETRLRAEVAVAHANGTLTPEALAEARAALAASPSLGLARAACDWIDALGARERMPSG